MAPMRDLICGGCELADNDTTEFSPLSLARREHLRRPRQFPLSSRGNLPRRSGMTNRKTPENAKALHARTAASA
jgi:hypothetical protein